MRRLLQTLCLFWLLILLGSLAAPWVMGSHPAVPQSAGWELIAGDAEARQAALELTGGSRAAARLYRPRPELTLLFLAPIGLVLLGLGNARRLRWTPLVLGVGASLPELVWISFDVDGLDPAHCPHTGTPVPGGPSFVEACLLLEALPRAGKRIVGFDLCEVAPGPGGDEWDANVGARLLYKLCGFALRSPAPAD